MARRRGAYRPYRTNRRRRSSGLYILILILALVTGVIALRHDPWLFPPAVPYDRTLYAVWSDLDGDCRDARTEALIREAVGPVGLDPTGCTVVAGRWRDAWTGQDILSPADAEVDHVVPLAEAHRSGADLWPEARRRAFANDETDSDVLAVVLARTNRSKGEGDPLVWLPAPIRICAYVARWQAVKSRWELSSDLPERLWVQGLERICAFL